MRIQVLYFALVRERLQRSDETVELAPGTTVGGLLEHLCGREPWLKGLAPHLQLARNLQVVARETVLCDGDEVALIPPVSGGSGAPAPLVALRETPLSLDEVVRAVSHAGAGGLCTFTGMVRDASHGKSVLHLVYEAYAPMAEAAMRKIAIEIEELHGARVAILHRLGTLGIGELAVVIAASAPHRAEAFEACRAAIDRLKREVPIWKKEVSTDGSEWVGCCP